MRIVVGCLVLAIGTTAMACHDPEPGPAGGFYGDTGFVAGQKSDAAVDDDPAFVRGYHQQQENPTPMPTVVYRSTKECHLAAWLTRFVDCRLFRK